MDTKVKSTETPFIDESWEIAELEPKPEKRLSKLARQIVNAFSKLKRPSAYQVFKQQLEAEDDYAWAWHCNIAMKICDSSGIDRATANNLARLIMTDVFGISDKYFTKYWRLTQTVEPDEEDYGDVDCEHVSCHGRDCVRGE